VVSTRVGVEGLAEGDGEFAALADDPSGFARHVLRLLRDAQHAGAMAERARNLVVATRDMSVITARLVESYAAAVQEKREAVITG